jgi:glycerophosphoryl diester phosphodiesterase
MILPQPPQRPLVFGHRGASALAPENTLAAFRLAEAQGADGIELDARLSRDGQVMVLHDGGVKRVTGADGVLAKLTRAEIQRLDAGQHKGATFAGERIPALEEVFEACGDRIFYDLEMKNLTAPNNGLEARVLALVRRYHLEERVLITSFNPRAVAYFQRELPQAPAGLLLIGGWAGQVEESLARRSAAANLVGIFHAGYSPEFPRRLKERRVLVWGVQTDADVRRAAELGASGVIADDPGKARQALEAV